MVCTQRLVRRGQHCELPLEEGIGEGEAGVGAEEKTGGCRRRKSCRKYGGAVNSIAMWYACQSKCNTSITILRMAT